jgi:hypothetical protein
MSTLDPFGRTDQLDEATLEALVARFEARGASPVFSRMLQEYLDAMGIDGAVRVLDMVAARAWRRAPSRVGPTSPEPCWASI